MVSSPWITQGDLNHTYAVANALIVCQNRESIKDLKVIVPHALRGHKPTKVLITKGSKHNVKGQYMVGMQMLAPL